jgi:oligogalacturonide transporter
MTKDKSAKNSLKAKFCYAAGDIYGGGAFMIFSLFFMNFLVLVEGLPVMATTAIIFIGRLWDAITDPIVGRISDGTRSRYGRRRIFFLIGIVPVYLSFVMLFYSFGIENTAAKIAYYTFSYMFFGTAFAIVMVPYNAILSDMISDYNERTSFTTVRMLFSGGAALLSAVIPSIMIRTIGDSVIGPGQKPGYLAMALVFAGIFALSWIAVFLGTKERDNLPPPEKIGISGWLSVFRNKAYRNFLGIFLSFQVAVDLVLAMLIFYIDIVVQHYRNYEIIVGTLLVCSILLLPVMEAVAKKHSKAHPLYIGLPVWIAATAAFIWLDSGVPVIVMCVLAALIASGAAAGNLSTWSMLTDVFDIDELITGKRREGVYSGTTTFLRKAASGIAVMLMGLGFNAIGFDQNRYALLKAGSGSFDPVSYSQEAIVSGIRLMFVLTPLVLLGTCLVFALRNRITKRRFEAVLKAVECIKTQGSLEGLSETETADVLAATGAGKDRLWGGRL